LSGNNLRFFGIRVPVLLLTGAALWAALTEHYLR